MDFDKDDDFLCDFDVDAAVQKQKQKEQQQKKRPAATAPSSAYSSSPYQTNFSSPGKKSNPYAVATNSPSSSLKKKNPYSQSPSSKHYQSSAGGSSHTLSPSPPLSASPNKKFKSSGTNGTASVSAAAAAAQTSATHNTTTIDEKLKSSLQSTLSTYFGHTQFRSGQLQVLSNLLSSSPRDTCIFWSTGSGKSLCYQLPPLHLHLQTQKQQQQQQHLHQQKKNPMSLVISPLLSLIEDQVFKLNGITNSPISTFLSSSQTDPTIESSVLKGDYRVVYLTPEKLSSSSLLSKLARAHASGKLHICLIAIDECHCVSEWGHDFRPDYLKIGQLVRINSELQNVPLVALTATAIPKVQEDIQRSLKMEQGRVLVVKQSLDRDNLVIEVKSRSGSGGSGLKRLWDDLELEKTLKAKKEDGNVVTRGKIPSTIIYAPTRKLVEEIASYLIQRLSNHTSHNNPIIEPYHAGLSPAQRTKVHTAFLIGQTPIIVATIAFGMGIDKTDIRRIYHYGPPKTMEEYYQQIGRAGRDGLASKCVLYVNGSGDFDRYKSDFYMPKFNGEGKNSQDIEQDMHKSINALRNYAMNIETCRRRMILQYYGEATPTFGEWCGTCDVCTNRKLHGDDGSNDLERDFGSIKHGGGARIILAALQALQSPSRSVLEKVLGGGVVEFYRYNRIEMNGRSPEEVKEDLLDMKLLWGGRKKKSLSYYRELLPGLVSRCYVREGTKKSSGNMSGYSNTWTTYDITKKGIQVLNNTNATIMLPMPPALREAECQEEKKRQETLAALRGAGVDINQVPKEELENGDGEVLTALKRWHSYIDMLHRSGRSNRVDELDDLRSRIEAWRSDMAERYRMAPASVMEEHVLVKIAYAVASMRDGARVSRDALFAVGVRSGGLDDLVKALGEWMDDTKKKNGGADGSAGANSGNKAPGATSAQVRSMVFPTHHFKPSNCWEYAVYKPNKKTGLAAWESSYNRFAAGEHPQTIAMTPKNGKPIQVSTVIGHILDGMTHGRPVDLFKLSSESLPPNEEQWDKLLHCETETGLDVTADPSSSGSDGGRFTITEFLSPIMGNEFATKQHDERSEEEKILFSKWCGLFRWFSSLRRVGYTPSFSQK